MDGPNEDAAERLAKRRRDVILGAASSLWSLSASPYRTFRRAALETSSLRSQATKPWFLADPRSVGEGLDRIFIGGSLDRQSDPY